MVAGRPVPRSRRFAIGEARRRRSLSLEGAGALQPIRRSLIGFDGSVASMGALQYAARAARHSRGCLVVVSVVRKPVEVVAAWPVAVHAQTSASPEQCALVALRAAVEGLPADVSVVTIVCEGRAGPVLLREAARHLCDAIVVGEPSGEWGRLTGGVARYLRRRAPIDVIVVPRQKTGALAAVPVSAADPLAFGP